MYIWQLDSRIKLIHFSYFYLHKALLLVHPRAQSVGYRRVSLLVYQASLSLDHMPVFYHLCELHYCGSEVTRKMKLVVGTFYNYITSVRNSLVKTK